MRENVKQMRIQQKMENKEPSIKLVVYKFLLKLDQNVCFLHMKFIKKETDFI